MVDQGVMIDSVYEWMDVFGFNHRDRRGEGEETSPEAFVRTET